VFSLIEVLAQKWFYIFNESNDISGEEWTFVPRTLTRESENVQIL
jgi:hypothetical protein